MLYIFYLILLFQLFYLQSNKINKSNILITTILITQILLYIIIYNKKIKLININNFKLKIIYKNYKYGLLLLLSNYISFYSLLLLYLTKL